METIKSQALHIQKDMDDFCCHEAKYNTTFKNPLNLLYKL